MSSDYPRSVRVGDQIQRELAVLVRDELKHPDLPEFLTIVAVEVSRDLSVARVFYSSLQDFDRVSTQKALDRSAGFLRRRLAGIMKLRSVPELRFRHDDSIEEGNRMSALIDAAVRSNSTRSEEAGDDAADSSSDDAASDGVDP